MAETRAIPRDILLISLRKCPRQAAISTIGLVCAVISALFIVTCSEEQNVFWGPAFRVLSKVLVGLSLRAKRGGEIPAAFCRRHLGLYFSDVIWLAAGVLDIYLDTERTIIWPFLSLFARTDLHTGLVGVFFVTVPNIRSSRYAGILHSA